MKKLSVVVAGTGQIRDVEIQPGTTAGDVLHQLGLKDYLAVQRSERSVLRRRRVGLRQGQGRREDLRLHQSRGRRAERYARKGPRHPACPRIAPRSVSRRWCGGKAPQSCPAPPDSLLAGTRLDARGQHLSRQLPDDRTRHSTARSSRSTRRPSSTSISIAPRTKSAATATGPVSQHRGNDWYLVHMGSQPKDVSSGIITIERLISEAYEA